MAPEGVGPAPAGGRPAPASAPASAGPASAEPAAEPAAGPDPFAQSPDPYVRAPERCGPYVPAALHAEIERFYARQAQLLGEGRLDRWALTFTEDAVFAQEAQAGRVWTGNAPSERRGRAAIVAAARGAVAARREAAAVRRYLIGMLSLSPVPDAGGGTDAGAVRTLYRAVLLQIPRGGAPEVYLSTTGRDVLVRQDGDWRVRHRINSHDNAPADHAGAPARKDPDHG